MYPASYILGLNRFKNGAWFDPSLDDRIEWGLKLLDLRPGDTAVDIGSGDGRVVVKMAEAGAKAVGIEKEAHLVTESIQNAANHGLKNQVRFVLGDLWQQSYADYNKVYIYQFKTVMRRLEQKLMAELPVGTRVVSNYWKFPHWKISAQLGDVYLYVK
jgi:precorrin-6B methylase 2